MGTTFRILAITDGPDAVRTTVASWARSRGFDPAPRTLPSPDPDHERVARVSSTERWTALLWSDPDEVDRLEFEYRKGDLTLLTLGVLDSDAWGWRLWKDGRWVAAFSSDPEIWGDVPVGAEHDLVALCDVCGADPTAVARAEGRRGPFAEEALFHFARAIGLPIDGLLFGESSAQRLAFRRAGWDPVGGFDVRELQFRPYPAPQYDEAFVRELALAHTPPTQRLLLRAMMAFSGPIALVARLFVTVQMWFRPPPPERVPWRRDGDRLVSAAGDLSIELPAGAEPARVGLGGVLAFVIDGDVVVFDTVSAATARRCTTIGAPGTAYDVRDFDVGGLPARRVVATATDHRPASWQVFVRGPDFVVIGTASAPTADRIAQLDVSVATLELAPRSE